MSSDPNSEIADYYDGFIGKQTSPDSPPSTIFGFPRGRAPGTAVHHIFEHIAFDDDDQWDDVIHTYLQRENIGLTWQPTVRHMIRRTVNKPLLPSKQSLKLTAIPPKHMIPELRFHFTNRHVELQDVLKIIRRKRPPENLPENDADNGLMTGFIDLVFQFDEQYYILDYKTNHLGNTTEDYNQDELTKAMTSHFYDLQYHLYLVALHRFLGQKLPNYNYETHIGGALYLFVRGINKNTDAGIFFDRPDAARINELDDYFKQNNL